MLLHHRPVSVLIGPILGERPFECDYFVMAGALFSQISQRANRDASTVPA